MASLHSELVALLGWLPAGEQTAWSWKIRGSLREVHQGGFPAFVVVGGEDWCEPLCTRDVEIDTQSMQLHNAATLPHGGRATQAHSQSMPFGPEPRPCY